MNLKGKRIKLISMFDPYTKLKSGDVGTIKGKDDMGHILVDWDNGSNLNLIDGVDEYEILESLKYIKLFDSYHEYILEGQWDSSIKKYDIIDILPKIYKVQEFIHDNKEDFSNKIISILKPYDKIVISFISDMFLNNYWFSENNNGLIEVIIDLGDKIMNKYGTEPRQVINAIEDVISYFSRWLPNLNYDDDLIESLITEKNVATNSALWSQCKAWAKSKYDVWPSAYAVGAAAKRYKSKGGKWKKKKSNKK